MSRASHCDLKGSILLHQMTIPREQLQTCQDRITCASVFSCHQSAPYSFQLECNSKTYLRASLISLTAVSRLQIPRLCTGGIGSEMTGSPLESPTTSAPPHTNLRCRRGAQHPQSRLQTPSRDESCFMDLRQPDTEQTIYGLLVWPHGCCGGEVWQFVSINKLCTRRLPPGPG